MLTFKRAAGVKLEVNLRNPLHAGNEAQSEGNSGQMSPQVQRGVSVAKHEGLMSSKNIFKKLTTSLLVH